MFDYIDSSGNIITYDQINKMAKEGKTSFDAIIKKNGYKQKPKPNNTQYGKALLSNTPNQVIGPKVKKDTPIIATKKKEPVVKKTSLTFADKVRQAMPEAANLTTADLNNANKKKSTDMSGRPLVPEMKKIQMVDLKVKDYGDFYLKEENKIGDYLTSTLKTQKAKDTFFSSEEEEGKETLEKLYAGIPGLTFEETNATGGDISNIFDAVKAVYIDPTTGERKESEALQFDIGIMNSSAKDRPILANKNADILKDFFNKNLKNVNLAKNKSLREESKLMYNKELNKSITPEFRAEVNAKFDDPNLFKPRKEYKVSMAATGQIAQGGTGYSTEIVKPYEDELKAAKKKVLADNPNITKEKLNIEANKLARSLLKFNAINNKKADFAKSIIENDKSLQSKLYVGSLLSNEEAVKVQNNTTTKLKVSENTALILQGLGKDCESILRGDYKTEDESSVIANKFESVGITMDTTDTELLTLKNGNVITKGFYNALSKLADAYNSNNLYATKIFKEQNDNLEKLSDSDIFSTAAAKNYDLTEKYLTNVGAGLSDILVGASYFSAKVLTVTNPIAYAGDEISKLIYGEDAQTTSGKLDEWAVNYTKAVGDIRQSYVRDVSFEDAFSNGGNFGKFAAQEISQQIPILMAIAATGGAAGVAGVSSSAASTAMIGTFGAGSKMAEMQTQIARGEANYSDSEMWLKSIGFGASEALFERLTTIPILKRGKAHFGVIGADDILDTSMKTYFKSKTPGFVYDQFLESAGEMGTTVTQNIIDGRPVMENVAHAGFSGFGMGTVMAGVPYTHGLYISAFSDYNSKKEIRNLHLELKDLGKQFELTKKRSEKRAVSKLMDSKQQEINIAIEKQQGKINENLRAKSAQDIISIESEKAKLQNEAKSIVDDKSIADDLKEMLIKDLRTKYKKLNDIKEKALDSNNLMQDKSKFILLETSDADRYNNLIDQATIKLGKTGATKKEAIEKEAYELYLGQEIDINIENVGKVEGAVLNAYDTKKEAINAAKANADTEKAGNTSQINTINKDKNLSDSEKAKQIKILEDNNKAIDNEFNIISTEINAGADGYKSASGIQVVIKENMLENQRTQIATHEVGHYVFDKIFLNNEKAFIPIANQLLVTTQKLDKKLYDKLIKNTEKDDKGNFKAAEVISRFLEAVSSGDISFAEKKNSFLSGLFGSMIQKEFIDQYDFDFKGQTDMFNFVVGLGKKIKSGELTLKDISEASQSKVVKTATELAKTKTYSKLVSGADENVAFSKSSKELKAELEDIKENEGDYDPYDFDQQIRNLEGKIKRAIEKEKSGIAPVIKKEIAKKDSDKEIIKNEKIKTVDEKKLGNEIDSFVGIKDANGNYIMTKKEWDAGGSLRAKEKLIDGKMLDPLIKKELTRNGVTSDNVHGVPMEIFMEDVKNRLLEATLLKFNPVNNSLGGFILGSQFGLKNKIGDVVNKYKKQLSTSSIDVEAGGVGSVKELMSEEEADFEFETAVGAKGTAKYNNALEAKVFSPEILKTATNKIVTIVRTLKSRIDAPVTLNRTVTPLISEIRDEVGKQLDIDIKTMLGGKKDGVLKKELLRNKKYILENMTTTWLMAKDGQGGIPQAIQKQIDGKWVSFPDWVGQKIDREKTTTDQAGRTSGAELVRRLPNVNNNVSNEDFLAQIIGPDGNPIRGRKESLSKAMAEEGAFDIINADLAEEGPIFEALATNQERQGYEIASNMAVDFARQAERGNIKFSLNTKLLGKAISDLNSEDLQKLFFKGGNIEDKKLWNDYDKVKSFVDIFNKVVNEETEKLIIYNTMAKAVKQEIKDNKKYKPGFVEKAKGVIPVGKVELNDKTIINITEKDKENLSFEYLFKNYKLDTQKADAFIEMAEEFVKYLPKLEKSKVFLASVAGMGYITTGEGNNSGKHTMEDGSPLTKKYTNAWENITKDGNLGKKSTRFNKINKETGIDDRIIQINSVQAQVNKINNTNKDKATKINELKEWLKAKKYIENKPVIQDFYNSLFFAQQDFLYDAKNKEDYLKRLSFLGTQARLGTYLIFGARQLTDLTHIEIVDKKPRGGFTANIEHVAMPHVVSSINLFRGVVNKSEQVPSINNTMSISSKNRLALDRKTGTLSNLGALKILAMKDAKLAESLVSIDELSKGKIVTLKDQIGDISFSISDIIENNNTSEAITNSFKFSKSPKGISVFDFDDTVGLTKGSVLYTMPDGHKGKLNAEEFAKKGAKFLEEGAVFDFSEFSKVVDGKPGPMVEKMKKMIGKFGPENFFILTARPAEAAGPIHEFLSSIGINIPLENITGLGNSTAQAKADWMVGKAAEGYNDFYFSDDAIQNVKAVKDALNVLDVKSKIQQAKIKFSLSMSDDFNRIIEENKGVESYKVYSDITARRRGLKKNRFDFYVPPSAADFELILYKFMGKGELGEDQKQFFQDALIKPYINGVNLMDSVRQSIKKEYKALLKSFPEVKKDLEKLTPNKDFTYDQAMRVAIWNQYGTEIPGLSQRDVTYLTDLVNSDPELAAFKDGLIVMGRQKDGWLPPGTFWDSDTIISDLYNITEGAGRKKFLGEFIENTENIFGKWEDGRLVGPNINKVEAVYGTNVREALEDSIYRMINGKNRSIGQDKETSAWSSWVNGSTGAIMFMNTRSAALQMLGAVNFLNWRDNNPFNAGKAFLNQPQYWKDFSRIWNSDKLKERRGGLREDVASAEIANAAAGSKNKVVAVTSYLLKIGYTPTQLADSFAIASGGAPFYRNRVNSYLKEGLTEQEAEAKAWQDFSKVSDETQQSGDPKDISKQQSSAAGRLLLVFQNFTMQQSRIVKKAALDLKNGRGDAKTNISKIFYYLAVQNIMFSTLQQGLFAIAFDDDDDEDKDKKKKTKKDAAIDVANGVLDSILRGTGFVGGITATLKNTVIKYLEEREKKQKAEYAKVVLEVANMSPPIGSKLRKTYSALQQTKYDKDLIAERGWGVMQDGRVHLGPMYSVTGKLVEVGTNFPMDRLVNKVENVSQAFNSENTVMQRIATAAGYSPYTVGIEGTKGDILIKETAKATRKEEGKIKAIETREATKDSIRALRGEARVNYFKQKREKAIKARERKRELLLKKRRRRMGE